MPEFFEEISIDIPLHAGRGGNQFKRSEQIVGYTTVLHDYFYRDVLRHAKCHLGNHGYASTNLILEDGRKQVVPLHQFIYAQYYGAQPENTELDHIDRNKLNNIPSNIRAVSSSVNKVNSKKRCNNTSGYVGVVAHNDKWLSRATRSYEVIELGVYCDKDEAGRVVNQFYRENWPEVPIPNPEAELTYNPEAKSTLVTQITAKKKNNTSGYKGVTKGYKNKWVASIMKDYKAKNFGSYENKEDAARAYNKAFKELYPDLPVPNPSVE